MMIGAVGTDLAMMRALELFAPIQQADLRWLERRGRRQN